jgi:hypothetical protein
MTPSPARLRILLLVLGVTSILGLLYWPEADEPRLYPGPNDLPNPVRSAPGGSAPAEGEEVAVQPRRTLSDTEFVDLTAGYGVVVMLRQDDGGDTGSFYFVQSSDSLRPLRELGFIQASALLDSTTRLEAHVDSAPASRLEFASRQLVDSALRAREDGCITEIPVPTRRLDSGEARWTLALTPGAAQAVPASVWRAPRDSAPHREAALRLARQLPADSLEAESLASSDSRLANVPAQVRSLHHVTLDSTELIIADVRRERTSLADAQREEDLVWEQRVFIAERDSRDRSSPFRVVWHHYGVGNPDRIRTEEPLLLLRLGAERLLTLYMSSDYYDGGGGLFIARSGPAKWKEVASWDGGC